MSQRTKPRIRELCAGIWRCTGIHGDGRPFTSYGTTLCEVWDIWVFRRYNSVPYGRIPRGAK